MAQGPKGRPWPGFRLEARFVDGVHFKGAWATELVFAVLEDEWARPATAGE